MTQSPLALELPTPVRQLDVVGNRELWVKDDGLVCPDYGGNKPRKLVRLLDRAQRQRATCLVTIGALGSHHVLATGILGRKLGLETTAISLPRPYCYHAEQTTKQAILSGVRLISITDLPAVVQTLWALHRRDTFWVPPGGSNALGALGYLDAVLELEAQVRAGDLPEPDVIFVALGTGGTAGGILAGLCASSLRCKLVAVPVLHLPAARRIVLTLARDALKLSGRKRCANLSSRLEVDDRWIGKGYGYPTQAGETAVSDAASYGLTLESTYTGKAFAAAMGWLRGPVDRGNVSLRPETAAANAYDDVPERKIEHGLFWSTISATKDSPIENRAVTLSPPLARLLRAPSGNSPGKTPRRNA